MKAAHLATVDLSLRFLVLPQLVAVVDAGGEAVGISAPGRWVEDLEQAGVRHVPLAGSTRSVNPLSDLQAAVELWRILKHERPDVLHTHNPKPGVYGRILGRFAGVPIVVNTVHGLYAAPDDPLMKRVLVYLVEALASRFSDAELVQSMEDLTLMERLRIASKSKLVHLGNGVSLDRFNPARFDESVRQDIRAQMGVGHDQVLVGTVGRLVKEKGYLELFEAAEKLDDNYRLVCIGPEDPSKADALDPAAMDRAKANGVIFAGMRDDVDVLYSAMDLFVLSSHREGFPRAAMEACAMSVPVVATDIRGCREVVDDGVNGLLVPARDPRALRSAIRALGDDGDRRREMGRAARRIAEERFDERRVVATVMDTYERLARKKGIGGAGPPDVGDVAICNAERQDVPFLAELHMTAIGSGFLPTLGMGFMRFLYLALVSDREAVVLVARDHAGPMGFVAGVPDISAFYRRFLLRYGIPASLAALPRLVRLSVAKRAIETLRYGTGGSAAEAELLSMAVIEKARGQGVGALLGSEFLGRMDRTGAEAVRVVVGSDNSRAISAYRRMGFQDERPVQVHGGEPSTELTWKP